jgi:hypothetical protein
MNVQKKLSTRLGTHISRRRGCFSDVASFSQLQQTSCTRCANAKPFGKRPSFVQLGLELGDKVLSSGAAEPKSALVAPRHKYRLADCDGSTGVLDNLAIRGRQYPLRDTENS